MAEFAYQAADNSGRKIAGRITAADKTEALSALKERGLFPILLDEQVIDLSAGETPTHPGRKRLDVLAFTQQLATLTEAGLQLDRSLGIMAELAKEERLGDATAAIRRDIQEGAMFSNALERRPRLFDRVYVNMVRAGEAGGVLPLVLRRIAQTMEEEREFRSFVLGAVLYPAVVATVSIAAVFYLLLAVVPAFSQVFSQLGQSLPAITRFTLGASNALKAYGIWLLLACILGGILVWWALSSPAGREWLDRLYLRLPSFGDLYIKLNTAKIARTLAMLTAAGVPVLQSFAVVKETVRNRVLAKALARAGQEIKEGGGIAKRLGAQKALPSLAVQMIAVGEETGRLPEMLEQVARGYDAEVKRSLRKLLALLEPALILFLTLVTLLIALSILIPIVKLSTEI